MLSLVVFNHQDYQFYPTPADSGFDSDYGGGGSYGSNNDYDYSSNSGAGLSINSSGICSYCSGAIDERFSPYVLCDITEDTETLLK